MKRIISILIVLVTLVTCCSCEKEIKKDDTNSNITSELSPNLDKVSLVVNDCFTDEEINFDVEPRKVQKNEDEGWKFYGYDVTSDQIKESVNGYFEIRIPYDEDYIDGDIYDCICAKTFNEESEQWEYELFEIDEANKEVVILTSHLSNHGIMMFKDTKSANKYGFNISKAFDDYQSYDEAIKTMKNFIDDTLAWDDNYFTDNSAIEVSLDAFHGILCPIPKKINNHIYDSTSCISSATSLATLGSGFENSFFKKTLSKMSKLGLYTSVCKLSNKFYKKNKTDDEVLDLYNTLLSTTVDLYGYSAEGLGPSIALSMSGVYVVSQVINEMFEEGMAIKMENMAAVYEYFGDQYKSGKYAYRTNKEWYDIFMDIFDRYTAAGKAEYIQDAIDREIRLYAEKFWELDADTINEVIDDAGYVRMPYPTEKEIKTMTNDYINNLYVRLEPIMTQCQKTMILRQKQRAMEMLQTCFNYCNSPLTLELYDKSDDKSFKNCIYCFKDLGSNADDVFNVDRLVDGKATITFTFGQYLNAGAPTQVELFEDEETLESNKPCCIRTIVPCTKSIEPSYVYFTKDNNELVYCLDTTIYIAHYDDRGTDTMEDTGVSDTTIDDNKIYCRYEDEYGEVTEYTIAYPGKIVKDILAFDNFSSDIMLVFNVYTNVKPEGQTIYYSSGSFLNGNISSCISNMNEGDIILIEVNSIALRYVCMSKKEADSLITKHIDSDGLIYGYEGNWK